MGVFMTAITDSRDFPTADAPQPGSGGGTQDAFAAKVSADGKRLVYSTYLGGSNEEWGDAVAPDSGGNVIAVGQTASINFPMRDAVQNSDASARTIFNPSDAYVLKLSTAGEPPPLEILRSGDNELITWPANFTGFVLESTLELAPETATWQPVNTPPVVLGGQFTVIQRSDAASQFFRLRRP
jgi:hypothetical protein